MTIDPMTKNSAPACDSSFVLVHSFDIRYSTFVIPALSRRLPGAMPTRAPGGNFLRKTIFARVGMCANARPHAHAHASGHALRLELHPRRSHGHGTLSSVLAMLATFVVMFAASAAAAAPAINSISLRGLQ